MIDVRAMRAAGLTDKQIVDTIEACQQERADRRKEQNRINKRNQRSRQQNAADSQHVSADMLTPSPPSLPLSMVSPITPSLTLPLSSPSTKRSCSNSFERFWKTYPRKVAKKAAEKALAKALRETSIDTILGAVVRRSGCVRVFMVRSRGISATPGGFFVGGRDAYLLPVYRITRGAAATNGGAVMLS